MDYESIHGRGISNFSPSLHRMPTVSAAQALQDLKSAPARCISTGLPLLDGYLQYKAESSSPFDAAGGVLRGYVTEIYGPPGIGKTALGMQLAVNALNAGDGVVWVDAAHTLCGTRLSQMLSSPQVARPQSAMSSSLPQPIVTTDLLDNLTHFSTPTLAHLIALISTPTLDSPPQNTSIMVIDSLSTLVANAFPRTIDATSTPKNRGAPNPSGRKFPILQYIVNTLQRLAITQNIAIVILSQCVSKMRPGGGAELVPAINITAWQQGLAARVVLFRDWGWNDDEGNRVGDVRLAQVVKSNGITVAEGRGALSAFVIHESGLSPLIIPEVSTLPSPYHSMRQRHIIQLTAPTAHEIAGQKRKISETDLEIPDSDGEDDEDYGWAEEDEEDIPAMPPQWQGSEDILVPGEGVLESEEREEEEEREIEWEIDKDGLVDGVEEGGGRSEVTLGRDVVEDSEDELALVA